MHLSGGSLLRKPHTFLMESVKPSSSYGKYERLHHPTPPPPVSLPSLTEILLQLNALTHLTENEMLSHLRALPLPVSKSTHLQVKYHLLYGAIPTTRVQPAVRILCPLNSTKYSAFKEYWACLQQHGWN